MERGYIEWTSHRKIRTHVEVCVNAEQLVLGVVNRLLLVGTTLHGEGRNRALTEVIRADLIFLAAVAVVGQGTGHLVGIAGYRAPSLAFLAKGSLRCLFQAHYGFGASERIRIGSLAGYLVVGAGTRFRAHPWTVGLDAGVTLVAVWHVGVGSQVAVHLIHAAERVGRGRA